MQKVRIMDGFHEGAIIEVPELVPSEIQLAVHPPETLATEGPGFPRQKLRIYNYRVEFYVEEFALAKGEWRGFLVSIS
jgi:hypothetical protein